MEISRHYVSRAFSPPVITSDRFGLGSCGLRMVRTMRSKQRSLDEHLSKEGCDPQNDHDDPADGHLRNGSPEPTDGGPPARLHTVEQWTSGPQIA